MRKPILAVRTKVDVSAEEARDWFFSLEEHPERYAFETHEGFEFESGGFGDVGARFRTRERFFFAKLELLFELKEVGERAFSFRLIRPSFLGIWGRFAIDGGGEQSSLSLQIGSESRAGQLLLRCYPVAVAVHRQICGEVRHIKQSMERFCGGTQASTRKQ